jgi:DNA-binding transcriptional LysR family regulator
MDRLTSMEVFHWVVELGSFSRAAERLDLSKASVTAHIAALESRLGVKLLNRTTRRLSLTDDGASYLEHVRRILADVQKPTPCSAPAGACRAASCAWRCR